MAQEAEIPDETVPPAGDSVHLPGPSLLPVVTAAGITIALIGVVVSPVIAALGILITVVAIVRWIRDTRADIAELPLEH